MIKDATIFRDRMVASYMHLMGGASRNAVARHFNVHRTIVHRLVRHYGENRSTRDCPYSGRPRVATPNQDREIRPSHIQN